MIAPPAPPFNTHETSAAARVVASAAIMRAKGEPPGGSLGDDPPSAPDPALAPTLPHAPPLPGALPLPVPRRGVPRSLQERYEGVELLGEGGMGTVYRAHDPRLGRAVAIKLLKGDDPELWPRFIAEARAQAKIQHEHVCRVYEAGQADGEPFIVMELIEGEPLSKAAAHLPIEQLVKLMAEVSAAVHEAHRLGMIHRDIKPGNVMVERREDGTYKPYVMDFGLAREVEEKGQTRTGAIVGTPAYMPPEQARGDVRAMDRRSDVYSLGATLYDAIAGRPPFEAEHPWKLLLLVAYEEPPPLGKLKKGVPRDLETIVMKCLEREPGQRYDSARALAEDLRRFLDGEPIAGKRATLGYVAWKKVKKHKLVSGLAATMVIAALAVSVAWARAAQEAAEQARLAQALGEDVGEMELFLRNAYGMPLHDVERERDVVRGRLAEIERKMAAGGSVGEGPAHYALGRGALALGDPDGARAHLEKALAAGYSSPELEYALGRALGEQLQRALEEARRITHREERRKREEELHRTLRDPALAHLRAATAASIEVPEYAEGLIALYEGRNEEAMARARAAFEKAPWMYEARKLEGDALYAMGRRYAHDGAFDHERQRSYFEPAARAYAAASEAARSDPDVHLAECELWQKAALSASWTRSSPAGPPLEAALAACGRAVRASSRSGKARVQAALALSARLNALLDEGASPRAEDAAAAERAAEDAVAASPGDVMAHYAVARARFGDAKRRIGAGENASVEPAIAAYLATVKLDPHFTWAFNELGQAFTTAAELDLLAGRDPSSALDGAMKHFDEASRLDPAFSLSAEGKVRAVSMRLEAESARGTSSDRTVEALFDALRTLGERAGEAAWIVTYWKAKAQVLRARHELAAGADPRASAAAARAVVAAAPPAQTPDRWLLLQVADSLLVEAAHAERSGREVTSLLDELRAVMRQGTGGAEQAPEDWADTALRIEMVAFRAAASATRDEHLRAAIARLDPALSTRTTSAADRALAAEGHALRAAWLVRERRDPEEAVAAGLARAGEALAKNPHLTAALVARGSLLLSRARAARDRARRVAAAKEAGEAFEAAFNVNPGLARDHEASARDAAALAR